MDTVVDGGHLVTLDGGGSTQILSFNSANWPEQREQPDGSAHHAHQPAEDDRDDGHPGSRPSSACSQGWDDGQGGADLAMRDEEPERDRLDLHQ